MTRERRHGARKKDLAATFLLWIACAFLVLVVSFGEWQKELGRVELETRLTGEQVSLRLEACFSARLALANTLAGYEWSDRDAIHALWKHRAEPLVKLLPGVLALNYVTPESVIEIVVPYDENAAALDSVLFDSGRPSVAEALRAVREGAPARTPPVTLLQSGRGIATYALIKTPSGTVLGYANAVFRIAPLMDSCLPESGLEDNYQLALSESGSDQAFYVLPPEATPRPWSGRQVFEVPAANRPWQMEIALRPEAPMAVSYLGPWLSLAVGLLLSTLVAWFAWRLLGGRRALSDSRKRYRFLVENQSDFVVQLDEAGRLTYASPSLCESLGYENEALLGTPLSDLAAPESADHVTAIRQALDGPSNEAVAELAMQTRTGVRRVAWSFAGAVGEGESSRLVNGIGRDLTDLRLLEARVAHADKMRAVGEMAGGVSHDFNNLLQVMLGNVELLKEEMEDGQRQQIAQVEAAILRALALTAKLATLSRQRKAERQAVDLRAFVNEVAELVRRTLPSTIELRLDLPVEEGDAVTVMADPSQLEQVLLNLAFNARDSIDGHGTIRIELDVTTVDESGYRETPELKPGAYARLAVCDDGCGISPDTLPRIFDPFFTTKGYGAGLGLGLSNCAMIMRDHGGVIDVSSTQGSGSTFTLILPLAPESAAAAEPAEPPCHRARRDRDLILVADDNGDIRQLVERILDAAGYRTLGAQNGEEAVRVFREHREKISLVLLDLIMPVMDGCEAASRIRELSDAVQILFMSGYVPADEGPDVREDEVLHKPFRSGELLARVTAAIDGSTASEP